MLTARAGKFLLLFCLMLALPAAANAVTSEDAFSPHQGATQLIVKTIGEAQHTIRVAAYAFTSYKIGAALVSAEHRGVDVRVVMDKKQSGFGGIEDYLSRNGVQVRLNERYHLMHDKFMVLDGTTLELGSFNYTKAAESENAENVLVLRAAPQIAGDYEKQWERLWDEAG